MSHHRHEWTHRPEGIETEQWACAECEAVSASCIVTDAKRGLHPTTTALLICNGCLDYEGRVIDELARALSHYHQPTPSYIGAIRYDREQIKGSRTEAGRTHAEALRDIAEVAASWAENWAEAQGHEPPKRWPLDYLRTHLMWAAHNAGASGWDAYREEIRILRHNARGLAGLLPQRQAGPCPHCGAEPGSVVRRWAYRDWEPRGNGLADEVECLGCSMTWPTRAHFDRVNRSTIAALPQSHPDAWVTLDEARTSVFKAEQIPAATWRSWLLRDHERAEAGEPRQMPERGHDERGRALYRLGDLRALVARRADDTRRGRRAG